MIDIRSRLENANPVPASAVIDEDFVDSDALYASIVMRRALVTRTHTSPAASSAVPADRHRRPAVVAAAAAIVVVLVLGATTVFLGDRGGAPPVATSPPAASDPAPISTGAAPSTTMAPTVAGTAIDPERLSWTRAATPNLSGPYLFFDGIVAGGPGLIAVGSPGQSGAEPIWLSASAEEWAAADMAGGGDATGYAYDVIAGGPGFVAVGSNVWTSSNGITWHAAPQDPIIGEARAVTVGGPGLVAVGTIVDGSATAWTSPDGLSWTRVPHDPTTFGTFGEHDAEMLDVIAGGPGLIAVGRLGGTAAVWTSPDGTTWTRVPHDPSVFGDGSVGSEMLSIAPGGPGFVAVSAIGDTGLGVWTSPDGITWSSVPLDPTVFDADEEMTVVVEVPNGVISAGFEGGDAAAWFSPDGETWSRIDGGAAFAGGGLERISDIAVVGDGLVAVGMDWSDDEGSAAVWIAETHPMDGDE